MLYYIGVKLKFPKHENVLHLKYSGFPNFSFRINSTSQHDHTLEAMMSSTLYYTIITSWNVSALLPRRKSLTNDLAAEYSRLSDDDRFFTTDCISVGDIIMETLKTINIISGF